MQLGVFWGFFPGILGGYGLRLGVESGRGWIVGQSVGGLVDANDRKPWFRVIFPCEGCDDEDEDEDDDHDVGDDDDDDYDDDTDEHEEKYLTWLHGSHGW